MVPVAATPHQGVAVPVEQCRLGSGSRTECSQVCSAGLPFEGRLIPYGGFSALSYAARATGRMRHCKVFRSNRTKMFHVKRFCPIEALDRSKLMAFSNMCIIEPIVAGEHFFWP